MNTIVTNLGERILFLGFFLTPFTSFRFGPVGLGEILILVATAIAILSSGERVKIDKKLGFFYTFWLVFLSLSVVGMYYNNFFFSFPSGRPGTPLFDFLAYSFILVTISAAGHYSRNNKCFARTFFWKLFLQWGIAYTFLYALSFFTPSIMGKPLRYHQFFSPLVENVHQAASVTCAMAFIMLYMGIKSPRLQTKLLYFFVAVLFSMMALDSGSTKAMLAIFVGGIVSITSLLLYRPTGKGRAYFNAVTLCVAAAAVFGISVQYSEELVFLAERFFAEKDGAGARDALYTVGFEHGLGSIMVGYGPGSHAPYSGGFSDAHNTTLTIFLQSGFLGVVAFALFIGRLFRQLSINFALLGVFSAIGIYFLGGDLLRRLPVWIMMIGVVYFATDTLKGTSNGSKKFLP